MEKYLEITTLENGITITIAAEEDIPVRGNVMVSGDPVVDKEEEDRILSLFNGGVWQAWFCLTVKASLGPLTGFACLGGKFLRWGCAVAQHGG